MGHLETLFEKKTLKEKTLKKIKWETIYLKPTLTAQKRLPLSPNRIMTLDMEWFKMFLNEVQEVLMQKLKNFRREPCGDLFRQHLTYTNLLFSDLVKSVIFYYSLIHEKNDQFRLTVLLYL